MKHIFQALFFFITSINAGVMAQPAGKMELAEQLRHHVEVLASDSLEGRGLGTAGKLRAIKYIAGQFGEIGLKPIGDDYFQQFLLRIGLVMVQGTNVVGYLEGKDATLKEEYILIGAHYDHLGYKFKDNEKVIYHGADDNASGVAAIIEMARYFKANPQLVRCRLIFVAFDGEESGLLGSGKFISDNKKFDINHIKLMFSLDMVGMYAANKGLDLKGMGALNDGVVIAQEVASTAGILIKNTSSAIEARTDTWSFGDKGIPAVHAFTGSKSPYHKPEDTSGLLDYEGMAKVTTYLQSLIAKISLMPEMRPSSQFVNLKKPAAAKFNFGIIGSAGVSHHKYPDEFYKAKGVFAFGAGLFMQMNLGKRISLQPEFLFSNDGSKTAEGTFRRQSIATPVNLHFNFVNQADGQVKVYTFAGGYFRHSFAGKNGGKNLDFEQLYNDQEWGYNLGFGADIMKWQANFCYQQSLTNLSKTEGKNIFPTGWNISVGYKF